MYYTIEFFQIYKCMMDVMGLDDHPIKKGKGLELC